MDGDLDKIKKFVDNQRYLIQIERDEEETQLKELLKDTSVKLLTKYGFCFVKLKIDKLKMGAFDKPVVSFRPKNFDSMKKYDEEHNTGTLDNIKFTNNARFSRGDLVALYPYEKGQGYFTSSPMATGSVEKLEDYRLTVAFSDNVDEVDFFSDEFESGLFCVVQLVNDVTFRRYSECLDRLEYYLAHPESPNHALLRVLFDIDRPYLHQDKLLLSQLQFFDDSLNECQRLAVQRCVSCEFYSLIHGPPGTGKTKTVCEVIQQMAAKKKKVLVTAASNVAVDNIIERLEQLASAFRIIRVGNPTRSLESSHKYSLDKLKSEAAKNNPDLKKIKAEVKKCEQKLRKLSNKKFTSEVKVQRREVRKEIRVLTNDIYHIKDMIACSILKDADVIVCTQTGSYDMTLSRYLTNNNQDDKNLRKQYIERVFFDCVVLDEAAQSLKVSSWMPILMGTKVILAGDHKQLPPTVKSKKAEGMGLGSTIFEKLASLCEEKYPELITLLKKQYRMNQNIMSISSEYIYRNELVAAEGVKDRTISDLAMKSAEQIVDGLMDSPTTTLFWFDTTGANYGDSEEKLEEEEGAKPLPSVLSTASKLNEGESEIVSIVYSDLRNNQGLSKDQIGIISPYKAQVDLIRNQLNLVEKDGERCEVSTVDGFQGREKEVIILSLVRSNPQHEVGFLADERRLNVAITRPKRLLVIVGDSATVSTDPFMAVIFEKVKATGRVISVYELMKLQIELGQSEDSLRKWINSGTHLTLAHLKPKEGEPGTGGDKKKKKKKDKKMITPLNKCKVSPQEIVDAELDDVPKLDPTTNQWGIDNDLFARIEEYTLSGDPKSLLLYKKLDNREKEQLTNYIKSSYSLEIAFLKKNNCIKINRKGDEDSEYVKKSELTIEEKEPSEEMEEKPDLELLERERKKQEKKQRQRENKRKQQEEEEKIKKMTDSEYLDMIQAKKDQIIEAQENCPYIFLNTGKKCLKPIKSLGVVCKYCEVKFCQPHSYASMHGCDEADEEFEKAKFQAQHGKYSKGFGEEPMKRHEREALEAKLRKRRQEEEDKRKPLTKEQREKKDAKKKR